MSNNISTEVWQRAPYTGTKLLVLLALADAANQAGECWPSVRTIAAMARCSQRRCQEHIATLVADGWLHRRERVNQSNMYKVLIPPTAEAIVSFGTPAESRTPAKSRTPQTPDTPAESRRGGCDAPQGGDAKSRTQNRNMNHNSIIVGSGDAHARAPLLDNIISAGELPPSTNRAALAQLLDTHPGISEGEWVYEAAAAAEWFTEHERRLTLRAFGSWIERVQRRKRQLDRQEQHEQEQQHETEASHGQPSEHGRLHGARRRTTAAARNNGTDGTDPGGDEWIPDDDNTPWETEEERIRRYLSERATGQVG